MRHGLLRAAIAASLLCSSAAAQAADFLFTFSTDLSDPDVSFGVEGTVTGRILGLADDGTSSAQSIVIDSYSPDGSVVPVDVTDWFYQEWNEFTVDNGMIVAAMFRADNDDGINFEQFFLNYPIYETGGTNFASLGSNNSVAIWNNQGLGGVAFTRLETAVPEPSTWAMMLLGFGAAGLSLRSRRKPLPA